MNNQSISLQHKNRHNINYSIWFYTKIDKVSGILLPLKIWEDRMKKKTAASVIILLITSAAICGYFFMREYVTAQDEIAEYTEIKNQYTTTTPVQIIENDEDVPVSETE